MNPIEYIKWRARAKEQAQRLLDIIKEVEFTLTKTDPDYPWVNLYEVRQTREDLYETIEDIIQHMRLPRHNLQPLQMEFVMAFLDKYLPDVHYRVDARLDLYVTTFEVREMQLKKTLDVEFKGKHLEVVVDNPFTDREFIFDLRNPIPVTKLKESVFLLPTHHVTDDATGTILSPVVSVVSDRCWRPSWLTVLQVVDDTTNEKYTQAATVRWSVNIPDHLIDYYAICAVASFISLSVLSYVLLVLPLVSSIIGAFFARLLSKTKSAGISRAIFVGCVAGYIGLIASVMLGALGLNGHL